MCKIANIKNSLARLKIFLDTISSSKSALLGGFKISKEKADAKNENGKKRG